MTKMTMGSGLRMQADSDDHLLRLNASDRLGALEASGVLDGNSDVVHDRCVRLASRILKAPVSLVSYVDDSRQHFKAQTGLCGPAAEEGGTPLSHSFCQYVASSGAPLMVRDAREDPILADNGAVEDLDVIAYLGVPVHAPGGEVLGSLCVIDGKPRDWTQDELDTLSDLVIMLETELALRQTVSQREVVLQEMNHRVRNLFSLVNGMVRLDRRSAGSVEELADSITRRLNALNTAHQMIVPVVEAQASGFAVGEPSPMPELMGKLLAPYEGAARIEIAGDKVMIGAKSAVYLTLTVHELATNAAKYGGLAVENGSLSVNWQIEGGDLVIAWTETGQRWGKSEVRGGGFGSQLLTIAVENQLGGKILTEVTPDSFSHHIRLPLDRLGV